MVVTLSRYPGNEHQMFAMFPTVDTLDQPSHRRERNEWAIDYPPAAPYPVCRRACGYHAGLEQALNVPGPA